MRASAAAVEGAHNWRGYLPDAWADRVEAPLWVEEFQEYQLDAQRWVGYDADEQPCYTAHHHALPAQDASRRGGGVFRMLAAWRLRDERWLVFRLIGAGGSAPPRGFYVFSPKCRVRAWALVKSPPSHAVDGFWIFVCAGCGGGCVASGRHAQHHMAGL